jgi:CHAD domain-containing protein
MPLNPSELDRRVQKLRKTLQRFPKDSTVDEVHDLRTRIRRVEAMLYALELTGGNENKLLHGLKSIRKPAGKVRDMDVLTSHVVGLGGKNDLSCVVRLLHHLGAQRHRHAAKLHSTVQSQASELRRRLKQARRKLDAAIARFEKTKASLNGGLSDKASEAPLHAVTVALRLSQELAAVKRLGRNNLHAYRIQMKQLRYVLEIAETHSGLQRDFMDALRTVQKAIGEWHDWLELGAIAKKVLRHDKGCRLTRQIATAQEKKFEAALRITEQMRRHYLTDTPGYSESGTAKVDRMARPVLVAASEIAA